MHERDVVREFGEIRDQVADPFAGLAVLAEAVLGPGQVARRALERHGRPARQRFAVPLDQLGFVVPGLELTHRAGTEDHDDVLRLSGEMWRSGCVGSGGVDDRAMVLGRQQAVAAEQVGERDGAQRGGAVRQEPAAVQERASGEGKVFSVRVHGWKRNSLQLKRARQSTAAPCVRTAGRASASSWAVGSRLSASW